MGEGDKRPRLLDLFCGAGGAAMGYDQAGYEVVGVDIEPQPHYPFTSVSDDAIDVLGDLDSLDRDGLGTFDVIHASPPCQWGTAYKRRPNHVKESKNLVPQVRELLEGTGLLWVIEQPEANRVALHKPVRLCGSSFGLDVRRHRCFESSEPLHVLECQHSWQTPRFPSATNRTNLRRTVEVGVWRIPLETQQAAMGIEWMTRKELSQAIPPAYTEFVGTQLMAHLKAKQRV
jgi:DNA (cytosine-5)-methyltransferase 1